MPNKKLTIGVLVPWNVLQQIMLYNTQNSVATIIAELYALTKILSGASTMQKQFPLAFLFLNAI